MRRPLRLLPFVLLAAAAEQPNVLLIVSEDNGPQLGCYGETRVTTPHLDGLAATGVLYERAYVPYSVCSPSRAAFLTGLDPRRTGHIGLATHRFAMYRRFKTLPAYLRQQGYYVGFLGKTHINPPGAVEDYVDHRAIPGANFGNTTSIEDYAREAATVMDKAARHRQPFLLVVNYSDAHRKFIGRSKAGYPTVQVEGDIPPLPYVGADTPRLRAETRDYLNCVNRLDEGVGMLLDELARRGVRERTLILYLADHGGDFPRAKTSCYEAGVRVPMIANHAPSFPRGHRESALVSTIDLLPTILAATGTPVPASLPGIALQSLSGPNPPRRMYMYTFSTGAAPNLLHLQFGVRDERHKLIWNPDRAPSLAARSRYENSQVPAEHRLAAYLRPPEYELYDLEADPHEFTNLVHSAGHQTIKHRLIEAIEMNQQGIRDPFLHPGRIAAFLAEQRDPAQRPPRRGDETWPHLEWFRDHHEPELYATGFETDPAAADATWSVEPGQAEINTDKATLGARCLRVLGGTNRTATLTLTTAPDGAVVTFAAERWTRRAPFEFRLEAQDADGEWRLAHDGGDTVEVGRAFRSRVRARVPFSFRALRWRVTSPPGSGLLIDDLRLLQATPSATALSCDENVRPLPPRPNPDPVVFRRDGAHGYRIPSLVTAANGDVLAFCERRVGLADHAQNDIVLRRSSDHGATWSALQVIEDAGGDSLNDPSAIVLPSGEILLMYQQFPQGFHSVSNRNHNQAEPGFGGPRNTRTWLRRSRDHGATWGEPEDISRSVRRPDAVNIASPGRGIRLERGPRPGRLLFPVYENYTTPGVRAWKTSTLISDDEGKTWRPGATVPEGDLPGHGNENQVVELRDGSVLMSSRSQGGTRRRLALSRDAGETWEPYRLAGDLVTTACMGSVIRHRGALLHSIPNAADGRRNGTVLRSLDEGNTWRHHVTITPGFFAYSSLTVLADGRAACLYEADGYGSIRFVALP